MLETATPTYLQLLRWANYPSSRGKHQVLKGNGLEENAETMDNARAACHDCCSELHFWAALVAAASHSSPPPLSLSPLLPFEHLELVAAQTIRQLLFWRVKQHRRTNVEHSALQQRQRGSLRARERAREVRVHRRCPFARNIIRLIWSSLKLWSISRFTAPKCRKFAHSFGSLVGNLSKSIIHIYSCISYYILYCIYIFKCLQALPRLLFTFIKPSQATANWQCKVFSFLLAVAIIKVNGAKSAE